MTHEVPESSGTSLRASSSSYSTLDPFPPVLTMLWTLLEQELGGRRQTPMMTFRGMDSQLIEMQLGKMSQVTRG